MMTVEFKSFGAPVEVKRSYYSYHFSNGVEYTSFSDNDCFVVYEFADFLAKQNPDLQFFVGPGDNPDRWIINGEDKHSNKLVRISLEKISEIPY